MAGIYVHIPFCKSRCIYCDFYSQTSLALRQRYVDAVCREADMRSSYIKERVRTIYIGGGTPSQLEPQQLAHIFQVLGSAEEVTIEVNPDDVTPSFAGALSELPVNRVSMGAQTFSEERLRFLRRRHSAAQVTQAVRLLREVGIGNISVDLMYGFPNETMDEWVRDIDAVLTLDVEHVSAYSLQYEEGTSLFRMLENGDVSKVDEELERQMYFTLKDRLKSASYEHYEISNFARPGYRSRHNSSYWRQVPYLGLGAAAHSFDGRSRQWNVADVRQYIEGIEQGKPMAEQEVLTPDNQYNEIVMTALRTCEGIDVSKFSEGYRNYCLAQAQTFINNGLLVKDGTCIRLSREGLFVSDMIMTALMHVE